MIETLEISDIEVEFYSSLTPEGIMVEVNDKLTPEQKREFKSKLRTERDVVGIKFI